jgi:hypothetical protein
MYKTLELTEANRETFPFNFSLLQYFIFTLTKFILFCSFLFCELGADAGASSKYLPGAEAA